MANLRPYQKACVDVLSRTLSITDRALVRLPTAAGKTLIFTEFFKKYQRPDLKFAVIVNRNELVEQTYERFRGHFNNLSVYSAGFGEKCLDGNMIIASIQSLDDVVIPGLTCVALDEVHNFGSMDGRYARFLDRHPMTKVIGFTATPWNNNRPIYGQPDSFFSKIDFEISMSELIDGGFILPPIFKAPKHQIDTSALRVRLGEYVAEDVDELVLDVDKTKAQVFDAIPRLSGRKKVLWVCASIKHAELLCALVNAAGEKATYMHSKLSKDDQAQSKHMFENGDYRHMCCVMMATEGYDYPAIDAVCFMRPTKSATLFVQVIGRALRLSPGKTNALVLDYGRVVENCGPIEKPKAIQNSFQTDKKSAQVKYEIWACPKCFSYVPIEKKACDDCGFEKAVESRDVTKSLTAKAISYDGNMVVGADTGSFVVKAVKVKAHLGRKSKKPSIHICWVLDGRTDHDEYITENMWRFNMLRVTDLIKCPSDFFEAYDFIKQKGVISLDRIPHAISLTKSQSGFYKVRVTN